MKKDKEIRPELVLASFPRSGNTYLRNVLFDVYGIHSWNNIDKLCQAFERIESIRESGKERPLPPGREERLRELQFQTRFLVVKTHELPKKILPLCSPEARIVYLVRDGRDALVSMAHHRKDIIAPGSDYRKNLKDAILAPRNTHFGGWSKNILKWLEKADAVIHFEDLVEKPVETVEKLRGIIDLPLPDMKNIPTFDSQRRGDAYYGGQARKHKTEEEKETFNRLFFRSGKIGGWKDEMPGELIELFWKKHGKVSEKMGYLYDGKIDRTNW